MRSTSILIVHGTSYGQTAKIALRMADHLRASGAHVDLVDSDRIPRGLNVRAYDGVLIGGSVTFGGHKRSLKRFVRARRVALDTMPTGFFSVSGSQASTNAVEREQGWVMLEQFTRGTAWRPTVCVSLAGAIAYRKYNVLVRLMLRHLMVKEGGPTDTTRDHELTDWTEVQRFAESFATLLRPREVPAAV